MALASTGAVAAPAAVNPGGSGLRVYRPRHPERTTFYQPFEKHFDRYLWSYGERFEPRFGPLRSVVEPTVSAFLECGRLLGGYAVTHYVPTSLPPPTGSRSSVVTIHSVGKPSRSFEPDGPISFCAFQTNRGSASRGHGRTSAGCY